MVKLNNLDTQRTVLYVAKNGNKYPIKIYSKIISRKDVVFEPDKIENLCKIGCKNYSRSGGCPPLAPKFDNILWESEKYILICGIFDSVYKTDKVKACSNRAIHWKFQDAIMARVMDKIGKLLTADVGGKYLSTGYCMGCPGEKCAVKLGNWCRKPERRTFSMEATGINVVQTVKQNLGLEFYWYTKTNMDVPYMMKTILYNSKDVKRAKECICKLSVISYS